MLLDSCLQVLRPRQITPHTKRASVHVGTYSLLRFKHSIHERHESALAVPDFMFFFASSEVE